MAEMKPITLNDDSVLKLWMMYQHEFPHMTDGERNYITFHAMLLDRNTQMFQGPDGIVFLLRDMYLPDANASIQFLVPDEAALQKKAVLRTALHHLMGLFRLERLFSATASEVVSDRLELLGFVKEGTMRKVSVVDGERSDMNLYSVLKEDFVGFEKPKKPVVKEKASNLIAAAGLAN